MQNKIVKIDLEILKSLWDAVDLYSFCREYCPFVNQCEAFDKGNVCEIEKYLNTITNSNYFEIL